MLPELGKLVILSQAILDDQAEDINDPDNNLIYIWDSCDDDSNYKDIDDRIIDQVKIGSVGLVIDKMKTRFISEDWQYALKIITHNQKIGWIGEGWVSYVTI